MRGSVVVDVWVVQCWWLLRDIANVDGCQVFVLVASKDVREKSIFFAGCIISAPWEYYVCNLAGAFTALAFK